MAKTGKKMGAPKKPEHEKLIYGYRNAFNEEQNNKLKVKAKQLLGSENVQAYIQALVLRDIM